jgi:hypothetical protein
MTDASTLKNCQNPDAPCTNAANRWFDDRLHVCAACFRRFDRHGDGIALEPWAHKNRRRLAKRQKQEQG